MGALEGPARISLQLPAAAAYSSALTALRSIGRLVRPASPPPRDRTW